jgi:hypothetical protein
MSSQVPPPLYCPRGRPPYFAACQKIAPKQQLGTTSQKPTQAERGAHGGALRIVLRLAKDFGKFRMKTAAIATGALTCLNMRYCGKESSAAPSLTSIVLSISS